MAKKTRADNSGWLGWVGFASIILMLAGFFHVIAGLVALWKQDVYVATKNAVWVLSYNQWGWIHILGGLIAIWAAYSLMQGKAFGRIVAVTVAFMSAIANMAFVPIYPLWSILIITIDILVIWAVCVHAGELKD